MQDYFDPEGNIQLTLYHTADHDTEYWEVWNTDPTRAIIHWGDLGETGQKAEVETINPSELREKLNQLINNHLITNFREIPLAERYTLAITFYLESWGSVEDLGREEMIRKMLTEHLSATGNGCCDDRDSGSKGNTFYTTVIDPYRAVATMSETLTKNILFDPEKYTILKGNQVIEEDYRPEKSRQIRG